MSNKILPFSRSYTAAIPFDQPITAMGQHSVTGPIVFTHSAVGVQAGYGAILLLVADGVNVPNFTAFKDMSGGAYDNTNGVVNQLFFYFDGVNYCVNVKAIPSSGGGDTIAPTVVSRTAMDDTGGGTAKIVVVFSEAVNGHVGHSFKSNEISISYGSVDGDGTNTLTFHFTSGAGLNSGSDITHSYAPGDTLDLSGNPLGSFSDAAVTNSIGAVDTTAPVLSTATVEDANKNKIILTYNEALDTGSVPATGDFTVSGGKSVTAVGIAGAVVTVTVNSNYANGDTITFSYVPGTNKIRDVAHNNAIALTTHAVTNNIAAGASFPTANRIGFWKETGLVTSGGLVTAWNESTGNGKNWAAVSGSEPTDGGANGLTSTHSKQMTITPSISVTQPITVYLWAKRTGSFGEFLGLTNGSGTGYVFFMDGTHIETLLNSSGAAMSISQVFPSDGAFHVIAWSWSGVPGIAANVSIDGVSVGTTSLGAFGSVQPWLIDRLLSGDGAGYGWDGSMKRFSIFNAAHTPTELNSNTTTFIA